MYVRRSKFIEPYRLIAVVFAVTFPSAYAHHAVIPNFDLDTEITLSEAVLTEFKFVNPHVYLYLQIPDEQGTTMDWRCEMAAASRLKRRGWTAATLVPGQVVTIAGSPAWREHNVCHVTSITLEDGSVLAEYAGRPSAAEVSGGLVEELKTEARPPYLQNGQPNFSGPWVTTQDSLDLPVIEPTEAGIREGTGKVRHFDSPALRCEPTNIVYDWIFERESNQIQQSSDQITLLYGYLNQIRQIHLDQTEHPSSLAPSIQGHSIGRWEDDVLVVDTIGFTPGILSYQGQSGFSMYSSEFHVVERFQVSDDGLLLTRAYTFEDPSFMLGSYSAVDTHSLTTEPYVPYGCEELSGQNNQRSPAGSQ